MYEMRTHLGAQQEIIKCTTHRTTGEWCCFLGGEIMTSDKTAVIDVQFDMSEAIWTACTIP